MNSQPFYRKASRAWYIWEKSVTHKGGRKAVRLHSDKAEAFKLWHKRQAATEPITADSTVAIVTARFLEWCKRRRAENTYNWYADYLKVFVDRFGALPVSALTVAAVDDWIDERYGHRTANCRNGVVRAISRPFNWAVKERTIPRNPISGIERPQAESRETYITPAEWKRLMDKAEGPIHDILTVLRETGCRPHEARIVEARHVDRNLRAWVFEVSESKGKRSRRVVPLTDKAWELTQRLMLLRPEGPLLRNERGNAWTKDALGNAMRRVSKRAGVKASPYSIRHTFATDAIVAGVDPVTLSQIMGHKSLAMIQKTYAHLTLRPDHIQNALRLAVGGC
jgi:integrase